jgi:RHS repeat-associated protein
MQTMTNKLMQAYVLPVLLMLGFLLGATARAGVEITYIHNDALGSPVAGTDESGSVKWRSYYQPYGLETLGERQAQGETAGYTGHREDADTGLVYMGARYYSPVLGRFLGIDPAGVNESNIHSFNRYAYANNNPYRYVDPDGETPLLWYLAGVALFDSMFFPEAPDLDAHNDAPLGTVVTIPGPAGSVGKAIPKVPGRNLPFEDAGRLNEVNKTLDRIESGGPFPYKQDGAVFRNKEGRLPEGNFREHTVDTPGASNRGSRRIVQEIDNGKTYYTDDHYQNFIQIDPAKK